MASELPNLIWVDCEMTGLSIENDALVEIAVLVTDSQLNVLGEGVDLVVKTSQEKLDGMNDFVREMHTASGLITEIPHGVSLKEASAKILEYLINCFGITHSESHSNRFTVGVISHACFAVNSP